ncbi:Exopolyphosphatase [Lunatimonas lonarensis]|uniref:Exopolyphosphatase n=1 Tax=Lunatimonas lonarensis TaxID=1232681 RepID=R7ZMV6_9BACT|nr:exopolyphosphatase [Lunatimonas lonarensis]EON75418.1 Exopolyphosphatase [Lunatimonas lonarensis]
MGQKAAVIDMGTNTFHLLMVELDGDGFRTVYKEKIPVKLGEGGISHQVILPEAKRRAFHTLTHFSNLISGENIRHVAAFATSAVRNATNGASFVQEVWDKLGIDVDVIDGNREAELIYKGIRLSGSLTKETTLMMDIGGGSVEFIIGNEDRVFWKQSFEIGGQRMLDQFHAHDPIAPGEMARLYGFLQEKLTPLTQAIANHKPQRLVGASGTFDTLTDIYLARQTDYKFTRQSTYSIPVTSFQDIASQLVSLNKMARLQIKGMIPMRVDMIVVASCLIRHVLKMVETDFLYCSTYSLKEGAIAELLQLAAQSNPPQFARPA